MSKTLFSQSLSVDTLSDQKTIRLPGTPTTIKSQVALAPLTSFRVGGPAEWFIAPQSFEELEASFSWANEQGLPITLLGAGSNLLISDQGLSGLVIGTRNLRQTEFNPETGELTVGAGESLPRLAWMAAKQGCQGLEWAVGIPGTVGGAVVMNAGAHQDCTANILVKAQILLPNGQTQIWTPADMGFRYRTSRLQGTQNLVTQATFQLQPGVDPAAVMATTMSHFHHRRNTQPYHLPSCGSVFRNPGPKTAGWLIEQAGLKGYQIGMAQVAQLHANFILNCGGARASDIFQLIHHVQQQVQDKWSFLLEPEVKILGNFQTT